MSPLALAPADFSGVQTINTKGSAIKIQNIRNEIQKVHQNNQLTSELADFKPPESKKAEGGDLKTFEPPDIQYASINEDPSVYRASTPRDEIMEKLDKILFLLEEQRDQKTGHVTEEVILYSFIGIFIIFIVDSFARAGKYVR